MCNWPKALLLMLALSAQAQPYPGIGRPATPAEVAAWDIDVRADFLGLPAGSGSVAAGQRVWEAKCASCHGVFGESVEYFTPLVGGTTAADVASGRVARLTDPAFPGRTTLMKLATVSTLWDYIRRAMPWNAPKSLGTDEVYAVTAYLLYLGDVLPADFTLSNTNIAAVQARMPNRAGMQTEHSLWPDRPGRPDVQGSRCLVRCGPAPQIVSALPAYARPQHGNLAEQQRLIGPTRGIDTAAVAAAAATAVASPPPASAPQALMQRHGCVACHAVDRRVVGPSFHEIARRHGPDAADTLAAHIRSGGVGRWGQIPMPPQTLPIDDVRSLARWISAGSP